MLLLLLLLFSDICDLYVVAITFCFGCAGVLRRLDMYVGRGNVTRIF